MKKLYEIFNKKNEEYNLDDNYILEVRDLVKRYGNFVAVNNISFKVKKGSLFAFLGLNGAGKSTTINIITSIIVKNSGKVFINGRDLDRESYKIKSEIGIVFQNSVLDGALSAKENLQIRSRYYGIKKNEWKEREKILIDMLDLSSFYEKPIAKLSGGQKRRVDIARAMVHNPKLLILDEPTTGLDPQTRVSVWNLINMLREKTGMTVFLTTHYMEEAEKATYIVVMNKGSIIAEGTPNELKNTYSSDYLILHSRREKKTDDILTQDYSYIYNNDLHFYKIKMKDTLSALDFLKMHPEYSDFEIIKGNMDNVFLNITEER
ncbi:MAG: ATP-binding cassette domain-containing protein [Candidatus Enterosoma sp.]|nr:ATP-binding cassette domain-containing protein [Bacilli bacterium]MDY3907287.1 ATP-binding cassette domain-containing protein [Candidatus Enterosoma sp.]